MTERATIEIRKYDTGRLVALVNGVPVAGVTCIAIDQSGASGGIVTLKLATKLVDFSTECSNGA